MLQETPPNAKSETSPSRLLGESRLKGASMHGRLQRLVLRRAAARAVWVRGRVAGRVVGPARGQPGLIGVIERPGCRVAPHPARPLLGRRPTRNGAAGSGRKRDRLEVEAELRVSVRDAARFRERLELYSGAFDSSFGGKTRETLEEK